MTASITETKTAELIKEAQQLHDIIHNDDCYNSKDLLWLDTIIRELELRGYQRIESNKLTFERVK